MRKSVFLNYVFLGILFMIASFPAQGYSQKFNPLTDTALVLRLDDQSPVYKDSAGTQLCVDGDQCGYWGDLSGKGHHARAQVAFKKPVYRANAINGHAAMEWVTGVSKQHLSLGQPADLVSLQTAPVTLVVVAASRIASRTCFVMTKAHGSFDIFNIALVGTNPQVYNIGNTGSPVKDNEFFTYGVTYDPSITEVKAVRRYYSNGTCRGSSIGLNTNTDYINNFVLGDWANGSNYTFDGYIYAVYMYNRALSPSEMFQLETYIRQKYNQTWPGSSSDKIVLWDGNSISMNDVIVKLVAQQMNVPYENIFNLAWGAKNVRQMNKYCAKDIDSLIPYLPKGKQLISVGWEWTNELMGSSPSVTYQYMITYLKHIKSLGLQFASGTCLPRCNNVSFETARTALNDSLRADHKNFGFLADPGADPIVGNATGACDKTLYGDGLHPSKKADSIIAPYFANMLKNLTADTQAPTVPSNLSSSNVTSSSFTLSWTASTDNVGVVSYEIFKDGVSAGKTATSSFNISGLTAATSYSMTVKAKDGAGNVSAASVALNVTTLAVGPVKTNQTITFSLVSNVYYPAAAISLNATASSGLPVSYMVTAGPASVLGNVLTVTGIGSISVKASQAGNSSYNAAPDVVRTITSKTKLNQTITFDAISDKVFGDAPFTVHAASSIKALPVTITVLSGNATVVGNTVTITGSGKIVLQAVQSGNDSVVAALPVSRMFNVTDKTGLSADALHIRIYPSPAIDYLTIESEPNAQILISTISGAIVKELITESDVTVLDVSDLNGLYIIHVKSKANSISKIIQVIK